MANLPIIAIFYILGNSTQNVIKDYLRDKMTRDYSVHAKVRMFVDKIELIRFYFLLENSGGLNNLKLIYQEIKWLKLNYLAPNGEGKNFINKNCEIKAFIQYLNLFRISLHAFIVYAQGKILEPFI